MDSVKVRVQRGVEWLDENKPGWEYTINFEKFEMENACRCVLGFAFQEEAMKAGERTLNGEALGYWFVLGKYIDGGYYDGTEWAVKHGFHYDIGEPWETLQIEWTRVIKDRFDTGVLSG